MWLKWRHKFSSGKGEWEWRDMGDYASGSNPAPDAEDLCEELSREFDYSEHYRGIDYEIVDVPPQDIIEIKLREAEERMKHVNMNVKRLKKLLESAKVKNS